MKKTSFLFTGLLAAVICAALAGFGFSTEVKSQSVTSEQELESIQLPEPQTDIGRPLMEVLMDRKSQRSFSTDELSLQVLSNLLWAAFGINRPEEGKRTAPSAENWQEIDIYIALAEGLFLYEAGEHVLNPVLAQDIRAMTGRQSFVKDVPVNFIYVADFSRMAVQPKVVNYMLSSASAGCIIQNVYLYCASEGLATVIRGLIDRSTLGKVMKLRRKQKILLAQSVGYPEETVGNGSERNN